jgi:nucleoside-diphosphate-sugar epimerase
MKFLVTGATGFIASHLVDLLHARGFHVVCPVRDPASLRHLSPANAAVVPLAALEDYAASQGPFDYVIHAAGATRGTSYKHFYDANVSLTQRLLAAFSQAPLNRPLKRFVLVSTQAVAGPSNNGGAPLDESAPAAPISWYAMSKYEAEKAVLECADALPITIVRPSTVFGPRDVDVLGVFRAVQRRIAPYIAGPDRFVSIIYVRDLIDGILAAALSDRSLGRIYFLTNPHPVVWRDFVHLLALAAGKRVLPLPVPPALLRLTAYLGDAASKITGKPVLIRSDKLQELLQTAWVCSPERARRDFGWRASTPLDDAVRQTFLWYKQHGWL